MMLELHNPSLEFFQTYLRHNVKLEVQWISRHENKQADHRYRDDVFQMLTINGIILPWTALPVFTMPNFHDSIQDFGTQGHMV